MWNIKDKNLFIWIDPRIVLDNTKTSQKIKNRSCINLNPKKLIGIINHIKEKNLLSPPKIQYNELLDEIEFEDGIHRTYVASKLNQPYIPFYVKERDKNLIIRKFFEGVDFSDKMFNEINTDDFLIGGEFEWAIPVSDTEVPEKKESIIASKLSNLIGEKIYISDKIVFDNSEYLKYRLVRDNSVKSYVNRYYVGSEFVTPPLKYNDFLKTTKKVFDFINAEKLETNGTTGLHINISFKNIDKQKNVDPLKLIVLAGDEYLRNQWPRIKKKLDDENLDRNVDYVKSNIKTIKEILKNIKLSYLTNKDDSDLASKIKNWLDSEYRSEINKSGPPIWKEKHHAINIGKLNKNYVEFRVIGGENYQNRFNDFKKYLNKFLLLMHYSANKEEQRKEYLKKLYKIFSYVLTDLEYINYDDDYKLEKKQILPNIKNSKVLNILNRGALIYSDFPEIKKRFYEIAYLFENKTKKSGIYNILSFLNERKTNIEKYKNTIRSLLILLLKEYNISKKDIEDTYNTHYFDKNTPISDEDYDNLLKSVHSLTLDKILLILGY